MKDKVHSVIEKVQVPPEPQPYQPPQVSKKLLNRLIGNFIKEACDALGMPVGEITVVTGPIPDVFEVPVFTLRMKGTECILINRQIENQLVAAHTFTPLRMEIYRHVRDIQKLRAKGSNYQFTDEDEKDAYAFAVALLMLKGIVHYLIPGNPLEDSRFESRLKHIIHDELHEVCVIRKEYNAYHKQNIMLLGKSENSIKKLIEHDRSIGQTPKATVLTNGEKGTSENPFDNILQAAEYVRQEEERAYQRDDELLRVAALKYNYDAKTNCYNIPWANGRVTLQNNGLPADGFILNQLASGRFSWKPNLYRRKFLYRGQSQFFENCVPTMFRTEGKTYFLDDVIWNIEMGLLIKSHPLARLLGTGVWMLHDPFVFEMNTYGLCQHYYNRTTLLDLTSDLKAAQFFAVTDYKRDDKEGIDRYSVHKDDGKLGVLYYYELILPDAFQPVEDKYHLTGIGKQVFMRSGQQHGFLLNMSRGVNFNQLPQVHKAFFRHDDTLSQQLFNESHAGADYFPVDALEKMWKRKLHSNLTEARVSYKSVEEDVANNKGETFETIKKKLEDSHITVDMSYVPQFDDDLIDEYYENIRQGWWQEVFCRDVHFAGSDGILYKNALLDLPNRPEYRWAFYR